MSGDAEPPVDGGGQAREPDPLAVFTFWHPLRVRWSEVDRQGVVFNPNYLVYVDIGLTEYMRAIGYPYPDELLAGGSDMFAVNAQINFRAAARYDDVLDVCFRTARIGRTSLRFEAAICRGGQIIADGVIVYVNTDSETGRPVPVPDDLLKKIALFEATPPER